MMKRKRIAALGLAVMVMCTACGEESTLQTTEAELSHTSDNTLPEDTQEDIQKEVVQDTAVTADATEETTQEQQNADSRLTQDDIDNYAETMQAESWKVVQEYGFENGYSVLRFYLDGMTLYDSGDYYCISVTLGKPVKAPGNLKIGDTCELETDALTETTTVFTYSESGILTDADGREYQYEPTPDGSETVLYNTDDSEFICWFFNGEIYIRKDAVTGSDSSEKTFTKDAIGEEGKKFDRIAFDEKGMVTKLFSE